MPHWSTLLIFAALWLGSLYAAWRLSERRAWGVYSKIQPELLQHAQFQWERCEAMALEWQKKAESYRSINASVMNERDMWQAHHQSQSVHAANAQAIMTDLITRLHQKLIQNGITMHLPPGVGELVEEHLETWVKPALKDTGTPVLARGPVPERTNTTAVVSNQDPSTENPTEP